MIAGNGKEPLNTEMLRVMSKEEFQGSQASHKPWGPTVDPVHG